jgi:hypothetical protein
MSEFLIYQTEGGKTQISVVLENETLWLSQKQLTEQADRLQALEKQTSFFDRAHSAGVRNLKLAYLAAQQAGLIDDKGEADFTKLRTVYPELFFQAPTANAGNGTSETRTANNINDAIRRAAGRQ